VRRVGIGMLAVVALSALAGAATAGSSFESEVTIHAQQKAAHGTFVTHGKVKSSKHACEEQRKVVLYGRMAADPQNPERIGSDRTNDTGEWHVDGVEDNGLRSIQAKAKPKEISAGTCKRAHSRRIRFA
jgi:hypothetical protein